MPRIIMKSPYMKPNARSHIGNYVKYIATRVGVENADSTQKYMEQTMLQKNIIKKLLSEYPDSKDLYEYEDYQNNPTRGNADELIMRIAETHAELFNNREKYVKYIAERPRVEKLSTHGLFTDDGVPIVLLKVQKEVTESKSNVWTYIISLKREDAERLGYNNAKAWMNLIRSQRNMIAENMKIAPENFKWYAAFHNEGHHPHIHMIAYSTKPNEAYLTEKGIENIKSNLAKVIFRQDLISIYQKQTEHRDNLRTEARYVVDDLVSKINSEIYINSSIQQKLLELADKLSKTSGKKVYGYLKPDVKSLVDSIVEELASDDRIKKLYDLWYEQKENTIRTYTDEVPERIPLVDNKEFKSIKNAVIQEALKFKAEQCEISLLNLACDSLQQSNRSVAPPNFIKNEIWQGTPTEGRWTFCNLFNLTEDELEEIEKADEESVPFPFEHEENTSAESNFDSDRGVLYPHNSIKTKRNSVAVSSLYLLRYLCNMIQNSLRFEEKQKAQRTDKKLQQKINDKKQAQGLKM